jgi:hypothetical protein
MEKETKREEAKAWETFWIECCMNHKTLGHHKTREIFVSSTDQNINESPSVLKCTGKAFTTTLLVF